MSSLSRTPRASNQRLVPSERTPGGVSGSEKLVSIFAQLQRRRASIPGTADPSSKKATCKPLFSGRIAVSDPVTAGTTVAGGTRT